MSDPELSVLIVEDDAAIAGLYTLKLTMDGYVVHNASDGTTALVIFERARPEVVCVDARLPDGSGLRTAGELVNRGASVILLTNDQRSYESPPPGVRLALLKARTSPKDLSTAIGQLIRSGSRS
jgi:DNA-binding NtrC family response regulator